ncbi:MAG: branched-chain amino acid transaminase [Candidatus Bipolaricaulota bacterium]|nr:branched-chain amino acid transaminase [Candidatus Bipolaricaulota bacterium]
MKKSRKIWFDGQLVPWDEATVHVAAHALHYGSSVFEGIRAYSLPAGPAVFCLDSHLNRLWDSCRVYRLEVPYLRDGVRRAIMETIIANGHTSCYIRPIVFRGWETFSVDGRNCPTHMSVITVDMGKYLGPDALENGVDVGVSSWRRMAPDTYPAAAKLGGQYLNSQFIAMEAADHGYREGIALDINGYVSEGSGENVFIVKQGELYTPPLANSILDGITRRCVMTLAGDLGIAVHETTLPREALYLADEAFFSGTAAEITPIRSVDGVVLGSGKRGTVTVGLMDEFFGIVEGKVPDRHGWLTPVG